MKVFAEPGSESAAQEFIDSFKSQQPFKQLIEKKVLVVDTQPIVDPKISCRGGSYGIPRLAECDLDSVKVTCGNSELCPVYTKVPSIGAGGPRFPIVSSSFPWTTMLHEVVHTFGFTDEYAYTHSEVGNYCSTSSSWVNGHSHVTKNDQEELFDTEELATYSCKTNISWCKYALDEGATVVQKTSKGKYKIGSPLPEKCPSTQIGVFSGGSCQALNPKATYRPYFCPTVMGYPTLGEEFCFVQKRHAIIKASPNLIPDYYQKMIFDKVITATEARNIAFETSPAETAAHIYGIPEVDKLSGEDSTLDLCK
ncbi:MAG: hypothetical protein ACJ76H_06315 [Bacteriovoracaceae bacterium]